MKLASHRDEATERQYATTTPGAPIGNALRVASRVRSAYAALRYAPTSPQRINHPDHIANTNPNTSPRQIEAHP